MRRFLLGTGLLGLILSGLVGMIRSRPYTNPFFDEMIFPGCELPCFLGIRPGVSTLAEALSALHSDPRIDQASIKVVQLITNPAEQSIIWTWSPGWTGLPEPVNSPSFITLRNERITRIDLAVRLDVNDVLAFAGEPMHTFTVTRLEGIDAGWYYPEAGVFYLINSGCNSPGHVPIVYAIQIRLVQGPEPFTDYGQWRGVLDWQRRFCR